MPNQEFSFQLCAQSYDFFYSHGTSNSCGVLTAVKQSLGIMAIKMVAIGGRLLVLDLILFDGTMIRVINVYAPTNSYERLLFFKDLPQFFLEKMVLLGDFNSTTQCMDRASSKMDPTSSFLSSLLPLWNLSKLQGSYLYSFSYHHPLLHNRKSRLDQIHANIGKSVWFQP